MRSHLGFVLAALTAFGLGACASGGAPAPGPTDTIDGDELPVGEAPRDDEFTEEADRHFRLAAEAEQDSAFAQAEAHYADALDAARRAIDADARNPKGYYQAGLASIGTGDFDEADAMFERAVELHPRYEVQVEPLREQYWIEEFNAGVEALQEGSEDEALRRWERADAIWEGRPEAMLNLGSIYANRGEFERAAEEFEGALGVIRSDAIEQVDTATARAWRENAQVVERNLAQIYTQLGRTDDALGLYEEALARDPDDVDTRANLVVALIRADRADSARAVYQGLAGRADVGGPQLFNIGVNFYQADAFDLAAEAFGAAAEANPYNRDALQNMGQSLFQRIQSGDFTDAEEREIAEQLAEVGRDLAEVDPYSPAGYELQAQGLVRLGQEQEGVAALEEGDALPFHIIGTRLEPAAQGGGTLTGQILNRSLEAGTQIQIRFTFYSEGTELGTSTIRVQAPAEGETEGFSTSTGGAQAATGYTYEVIAP